MVAATDTSRARTKAIAAAAAATRLSLHASRRRRCCSELAPGDTFGPLRCATSGAASPSKLMIILEQLPLTTASSRNWRARAQR